MNIKQSASVTLPIESLLKKTYTFDCVSFQQKISLYKEIILDLFTFLDYLTIHEPEWGMNHTFISKDNTKIGTNANSSIMGYILLYLLRMIKTKKISFRFIYRDMKNTCENKYSLFSIIYLILTEKNKLTLSYVIYFLTIDIWDYEKIKHGYDDLFRDLDNIR